MGRTGSSFTRATGTNRPIPTLQRDTAQAKFWLAPVRLAWNRGFSAAELRRIEKLTEENDDRLLEIWNEYFDIGE